MFDNLEARIDRVVGDLLKGRRLRLGRAEAAEREAVMAAAALAGAREGYPRMSPAFRRRLAETLKDGDRRRVSRRTALGAVAGLAVGATGTAALARLAGSGTAPAATAAGVAGGVMKPVHGAWVRVAAFSELSESAPTRVVAGELVAFLFRTGDEVTGVSGVCSHVGWPCNLTWSGAPSGLLNCPCHRVNFRPDGTNTEPSYEVPPLPSVRVKVEAGQVMVFSP